MLGPMHRHLLAKTMKDVATIVGNPGIIWMPVFTPSNKIRDVDRIRTIKTRERSRPCKSSKVVSTSPRWWEFLREQQL
jgi:hypothetical protein